MVFKLPNLLARLAIVNKDGTPTLGFMRFFNVDFVGALERQERRQDEQQAELEAQQAALAAEVDRLNRVLAGTENFTGIQVGGQNVRPFLDRTDGSVLVDSDGLGEGVVQTANIALQAVTTPEFDFSSGLVDANFATPVLIATATATVSATDGEYVEVTGNSYLNARGVSPGPGAIGYIRLDVDGVTVLFVPAISIISNVTTANPGSFSFIDDTSNGTVTYEMYAYSSSPPDTSFYDVRYPFLSAKVFKR